MARWPPFANGLPLLPPGGHGLELVALGELESQSACGFARRPGATDPMYGANVRVY
jgi:hypothetical protein